MPTSISDLLKMTLAPSAASAVAPLARGVLAAGVTVFGFALAASANASPVTFDFNNMKTTGNHSSQGLSSTGISTYMTNVLHSAGYGSNFVTVTGGVGQQGASAYAGEGYVVGPTSGGSVTSLTLANTEHATPPSPETGFMDTGALVGNDGFIKNCTITDSCSSNSPDIYMDFHGLEIQSISFDFEIFPDGTCPSLSACGSHHANLPDLELWSGDGGNGTHLATWYGVVPGSTGNNPSAYDNTYAYSPNSHADNCGSWSHPKPCKETAPQLLATATLDLSSYHISTLDFMDWPETIAIDNLKVTFNTAPEPTSIAMFGLGFVGLAGMAWRKRARHLSSRKS